MEDELQKARVISDRMFKAHNERDFDLDWHKEKADQLSERWQSIHSQIDGRSLQLLFTFTAKIIYRLYFLRILHIEMYFLLFIGFEIWMELVNY